MKNILRNIFGTSIDVNDNLIILSENSTIENQKQTNQVFSEKWNEMDNQKTTNKLEVNQKKWYLDLYGFKDENDLKQFLSSKQIIFDAGCGLGYKTAWFAELAPKALVIGMDYSNAIFIASKNYKHLNNLYFIKGDIAETKIKKNRIDYVNCDQVLHHTENPEQTFKHLTEITKKEGEFACYVYAKKALPRELLDDYFRNYSKRLTNEDLWNMSKALTKLGKDLSELKVELYVPDIPLLGIKGGRYDLQRFIYWNFIKCYWNEEMGYENSVSTNFDWYAPSNAKRYSEDEFKRLIKRNKLDIKFFHKEEACYSGRFKK